MCYKKEKILIWEEKMNKDFMPLYTTIVLPKFMNDMTWNKIKEMSMPEFESFVIEFRTWALEYNEKHNHPIFGGNKTINDIIMDFTHFNNLNISKIPKIMDNKVCLFGKNNIGNSINHWFPEMSFIRTSKKQSAPMDTIIDEKKLINISKAVLYNDSLKTFREKPNNPIFNSYITCLKIGRGSQKVGQFPPHLAKWLYINTLKHFKDNELYVYDPCGGWAGRMIGILAAGSYKSFKDKKINFLVTDVNSQTHDRFKMVYDFWKEYIDHNLNVTVNKFLTPAEDMNKEPEFKECFGKGHMAFTSPPYFDKEEYSEDENQSYIRYKSYESWKEGFLYGLIKNTYDFLGCDGVFYLNIADTLADKKKKNPIQEDSVELAKQCGFELADTYYMIIPKMPGSNTEKQQLFNRDINVRYKFEPVFKFVKKNNGVILEHGDMDEWKTNLSNSTDRVDYFFE